MLQKEAVSNFDISPRQVQQILKEDPLQIKFNKQQSSKFNKEMVADLLIFINCQSTSTLKEMAKFLKNKYEATVTTQAISNLLWDVDITWKQVTNIPSSWN